MQTPVLTAYDSMTTL